VDAGREHSRRKRHTQRIADVADGGMTAPAGESKGEHYQTILDAIRALPPIYREPFVLRHLQDWNYRQIADVMDLPIDTIETRLVRARRLLRATLKDRV